MVTFGSFRTQEFSSCRRIEEQIAHADGCPPWMGCIFDVAHAAAFDDDSRSGGRPRGVGNQLHLSDRRNGSQRFTAKAQGANSIQILALTDLRGRMSFKGGDG